MMIPEELNQHNALSEKHKSLYQRIKSMHPEYNHKQIMAKIAIGDFTESHLETSDAVYYGGIGYGESIWDKLKNILS